MDEQQEKIEGMQAQIEELNETINDLQGTVCVLEDEIRKSRRELENVKEDARFMSGKIAAYEKVFMLITGRGI